jgi:hypothetical protein
MLKKSASCVLSSSKSSTYPRGYASGFESPAALLDGHFEHPASCLFGNVTRKITVGFERKLSFLQPVRSCLMPLQLDAIFARVHVEYRVISSWSK